VLAPFVKQSYARHLAIAEQWQIPQAEAYARQRTDKECYDAFQSLEYEVNTLHTANGQTPFVTFGFGLGTDWAARLIQQSILLNRLAGLGKNRKTAVFPKLVFTIREGVNRRAGAGVCQQADVSRHPQLRSGGESHRLV
jgi:ribonucleoside-triphosphate reductase